MIRVLVPVLLFVLAGCATPRTGPGLYRDRSMTFAIPAGWKVTMSGTPGGCGHACVEAPGEAIVFIQGVPRSRDRGLEKFARDFSRRANGSVPFGAMRSLGFRPVTDPRFGPALEENVTITLLKVTVPHTRGFRRVDGGPCVFYLVTQVADEDAGSVQAGFEEILRTFRPAASTAPAGTSPSLPAGGN
jgi:hypothetical protein